MHLLLVQFSFKYDSKPYFGRLFDTQVETEGIFFLIRDPFGSGIYHGNIN